MIDYREILGAYRGKRVLLTGNTGFKGSWLTRILTGADAVVIGYSLKPPTEPNLYTIAGLSTEKNNIQIFGDVRDLDNLKKTFATYKPDIVIHLAAQPIVRESYRDPVGTYDTNVMGTVNVCECIRLSKIPISDGGLKNHDWDGVRSFLNVTTDKVYRNNEWEYGYREDDVLDGFDPYSNSKSCSEMITHSYRNSFFGDNSVAISTARAGNVIGGGDFSSDRIIPDCVRAIRKAREEGIDVGNIQVRNPNSIRPYQHVLEPLFMYLTIAIRAYEDASYAGGYNVGPDDVDCLNTGDLVSLFCEKWNTRKSDHLPELIWSSQNNMNAPYEANFLKLDCSRIKSRFGWRPRWHIEEAIGHTVDWIKIWIEGGDIREEMDREINIFLGLQ